MFINSHLFLFHSVTKHIGHPVKELTLIYVHHLELVLHFLKLLAIKALTGGIILVSPTAQQQLLTILSTLNISLLSHTAHFKRKLLVKMSQAFVIQI